MIKKIDVTIGCAVLISVEQIAISKTSRRNVFSTLKQHNQRETAFLPKQQNVVCSTYVSHMLNKYQLVKTICSQQQIVSAQIRFSACFSVFFLFVFTTPNENRQQATIFVTGNKNMKKHEEALANNCSFDESSSLLFHWNSYELNITTLS